MNTLNKFIRLSSTLGVGFMLLTVLIAICYVVILPFFYLIKFLIWMKFYSLLPMLIVAYIIGYYIRKDFEKSWVSKEHNAVSEYNYKRILSPTGRLMTRLLCISVKKGI